MSSQSDTASQAQGAVDAPSKPVAPWDVDWSQFTQVKPESPAESPLWAEFDKSQALQSGQASAASISDSILGIVINVTLALAVGYCFFRLISPRTVSTPTDVGRKWSAWAALASTATMMPPFFRKLDINSFALWLLGLVVWGVAAFLLGWGYGRFVKYRNSSTPDPSASQITTSTSPESAIAERLHNLEHLLQKGIVSQGEYDEQRRRILHDL